jgi:heme exporter protein A
MRLSAENIALERGGRQLFRNLTFAVDDGEALIVTGPNGAGKSSLLRAIAGLLSLNGGRLALAGGDPELTIGEQAHYVGHADALKGSLTAGENLAFWAGALGGDTRRAAWLPALERLGLGHVGDFPVRALSAGQKRRVALARLLVAERPIWLIDEPTTALDVAAQALFTAVMGERLRSGGLIVAATHAPLGLMGAKELRLGAGPPLPQAGEGWGEGSVAPPSSGSLRSPPPGRSPGAGSSPAMRGKE